LWQPRRVSNSRFVVRSDDTVHRRG